jgi:hypothetical protein
MTFLNILVYAGLIGYFLFKKVQGQPIRAPKKLLGLPILLVVIGFGDMTSGPTMKPVEITLTVIGAILSLGLGLIRGQADKVSTRDGAPFAQWGKTSLALFAANIVAKLVLDLIGVAAGGSASVAGKSLVFTLGLTLLAEAAVLWMRSGGATTLLNSRPATTGQANDANQAAPASTMWCQSRNPPPDTRWTTKRTGPPGHARHSNTRTHGRGARQTCNTASTGYAERSTSPARSQPARRLHLEASSMPSNTTTTATTTTAIATTMATGTPRASGPEKTRRNGPNRISQLLQRRRLRGRHPNRPAVRRHLRIPTQRRRRKSPTGIPDPGRRGIQNADQRTRHRARRPAPR